MSARDYGEGVVLLCATWLPVIAGVELLRRRRLAHLHGVPAVLAFAAMLAVGLAGVHLIPGMLGILYPGTVIVTALLALGAVAWLVAPAAGADVPGAPEAVSPSSGLGWTFAAVGAGAIATVLLASLLHLARKTYGATDLISFDLPGLAGWVQTHSLWHITELFPFQTHGTYPQNSILTLLSVSLPFHNDAFLRAVVYPTVPLAGLAVYALARELRAAPSTAALSAAMFAACPVVAAAAEGAALDAIATAMFATGVYFLVRSVRTGMRSDLVLAGLGLGFALGAKWYHLTAVTAVVGVWAVAELLRGGREGRRRALGAAGIVIGVIAVVGGFWLVRNWVQADDPLYPVRVALGGVTIFDAPPDVYRKVTGFSIAHYIGDWGVWRRDILPAWREAFALPGAVLLVGVLAALVRLLARPRDFDARLAGVLAGLALVLFAVYLVTPYSAFGLEGNAALTSANARYLLPGLVVALPVAASLVARAGRARPWLEAVLLAAAVQGAYRTGRILDPSHRSLAVAAVLVLGAGAVAWWLRERPALAAKLWRPLPLAATALLLLVAVGYGVQRGLNRDRYAGADPTYDWVREHASDSDRIGLAGFFDFGTLSPAWPMFGERMRRRVKYVGPLDGGHLGQYQTAAPWARAVRDGGYDLVLVARAAPVLATRADEPRWAPAAGLQPVAESRSFVLYRVPR